MPEEKAERATMGACAMFSGFPSLWTMLSLVMTFSAEHAYDLVMVSFSCQLDAI